MASLRNNLKQIDDVVSEILISFRKDTIATNKNYLTKNNILIINSAQDPPMW